MISKVVVPISPDMTFGELEHSLCEVGKKALLEAIHAFEENESSRAPQDHSQATFASKIELEDCEIMWDRSAQELHNLVRGVNPYPGAWCYVHIKGEKKRLKINQTKILPYEKAIPGTLINANQTKGNLVIATGDQALELLDVQLEGKKRMSSEELTRGISRLHMQFSIV